MHPCLLHPQAERTSEEAMQAFWQTLVEHLQPLLGDEFRAKLVRAALAEQQGRCGPAAMAHHMVQACGQASQHAQRAGAAGMPSPPPMVTMTCYYV